MSVQNERPSTGPATTKTDRPLTADQIGVFRETGFVFVPGLIGPAKIAELQSWATEIQTWPEIPGKYMMYFEDSSNEPGARVLNRAEDLTSYHDGLHALMESSEMAGAVEQLFGEPAVLFKDKINVKMPGGGGFAAHQDVQAGWDTYASIHITAMVSIDRCTVPNGCLEFAPGRHRAGLIGQTWKPLSEEELSGSAYQVLESEPGDAVFFDSFAPHRSSPNRTDRPRRVLYLTYNKASEGDHRIQYYADKRASYPPDIEREPDKEYRFRV